MNKKKSKKNLKKFDVLNQIDFRPALHPNYQKFSDFKVQTSLLLPASIYLDEMYLLQVHNLISMTYFNSKCYHI